jgi:hypothetical protein
MQERRAVGSIVGRLRGKADENLTIEVDASAKGKILHSKLKAFKKMPDAPLGVVMKQKQN